MHGEMRGQIAFCPPLGYLLDMLMTTVWYCSLTGNSSESGLLNTQKGTEAVNEFCIYLFIQPPISQKKYTNRTCKIEGQAFIRMELVLYEDIIYIFPSCFFKYMTEMKLNLIYSL